MNIGFLLNIFGILKYYFYLCKKEVSMGTVDLDYYTEEYLLDINWDENKYTEEEARNIIKETISRVAEAEYEDNEGEIDDWDFFEYCAIRECKSALGII